MTTSKITPADDSFHPPVGNHPYWTETFWWSFDQPGRNLSMAVYPLFRPNQGICSLAVHLWDESGVAPWEIPYSRFLWHLPMPTTDLTALNLAGLQVTTKEPLQRYHLEFADRDRVRIDLELVGLTEPIGSTTQMPEPGKRVGGHFDQMMQVKGEVLLGGEKIEIDTFGQHDRSWYDRPDNKPRQSASVCHGTASDGSHFLSLRPTTLLGQADDKRPPSGHLVLDGVTEPLVSVSRRVVRRERGIPKQLELALSDAAGRTLELHGTTLTTFAFHCSPPVFAWFSHIRWEGFGRTFHGQDQEASSMDQIARLIAGDPEANPA